MSAIAIFTYIIFISMLHGFEYEDEEHTSKTHRRRSYARVFHVQLSMFLKCLPGQHNVITYNLYISSSSTLSNYPDFVKPLVLGDNPIGQFSPRTMTGLLLTLDLITYNTP